MAVEVGDQVYVRKMNPHRQEIAVLIGYVIRLFSSFEGRQFARIRGENGQYYTRAVADLHVRIKKETRL